MADAKICMSCAWRADCQKKFSISKKARFCPEYTKDLSLKEGKDNSSGKKEPEQKRS